MPDRDDAQARVLRELFMLSFMGGRQSGEDAGPIAARLSEAMIDVYLRPGEILYREGDPSLHYYFVVTGEMSLEREGEAPRVLGERGFLAIDATLERPRTRTAVAVGDVHLLELPAEVWFDTLEDHIDVARNGILRLSETVRQTEHPELFLPLASVAQGESVAAAGAPEPQRLNVVERILALRDVAVFSRGHIQAITMLAELSEEVRLREGDALFERGKAERAIFAVAVGAVTLSNDKERAVFRRGSLVGGTGGIGASLVGYESRALSPSVVLRLREEDYWDVVEEHADLVRAALMTLADHREKLLLKHERRSISPPADPANAQPP